ncbi:hypothetical protein G6F63_015996 [Rhizopus arrhizus]|nr:hypothetical protein G6F63_015996 [Rhizopus arrhizus]
MAVIVVLVRIAVPGELARRHALRGHHGLARKARGLRQLGQPGLEIQAVHEQHLRGGQLLRVARSGFVFMGIAVGSHQRGQADVVATHFAHDVPKDGKAGDRLHGVGGRIS